MERTYRMLTTEDSPDIGPFKTGDIRTMPEEIGAPLVDRGIAEEVMEEI